jgi:DNA-binding beta-propeller fold protein YncE
MFAAAAFGTIALNPLPMRAQQAGASYLLFVASRATGLITLVRFTPTAGRIEHRTMMRLNPDDPVDPIAITVVPAGRRYFVLTTRSSGRGEVVKVSIATDSARGTQISDTLRGGERVGTHPSAIALTADSGYVWVTNGDTTPNQSPASSSVSVVDLTSMVEVARIATCAGGRGSKFSADGSHHYSVCSQGDSLVEIDQGSMKVTRKLGVGSAGSTCDPSSVDLAATAARAVIGCARSSEVLDVDLGAWTVARRIAVPSAGSAIAVTPDGATAIVGSSDTAGTGSATIVDLNADTIAGTIPLPGTPNGMAMSPDGRYLFVTMNGNNPSLPDVTMIDLETRKVLASLSVGNSADAIAFWKVSLPAK